MAAARTSLAERGFGQRSPPPALHEPRAGTGAWLCAAAYDRDGAPAAVRQCATTRSRVRDGRVRDRLVAPDRPGCGRRMKRPGTPPPAQLLEPRIRAPPRALSTP